MARKYCGTIKFNNNLYDVHWDTDTKKVYISKLNHPELSFIHYFDFKATRRRGATRRRPFRGHTAS